jgi:polysaccharide biosynthesis protein PslG
MESNRRDFLRTLSLAPLTVSLPGSLGIEDESGAAKPTIALNKIGQVTLKKPKDIKSSPFGIGCETLDRQLWEPKEVYPWLDDMPVKWGRLQTGWNRVEREKGKYDWAWLDESVDGLIARGIQPFFNVGYGNKFYTEGEMGFHPMDKPEALTAFKAFVTALAKRYKGRVQHYEIWNEPNLSGFWQGGKVDPKKYVELVRQTAPLIRKNCPGSVIVGGVVSRLPIVFIKALFQEGLAKEIDVFSFHPYTSAPESYNDKIVAVVKLVKQHNPKIKIWQGENGFPSEPNSTGYVGIGPYSETIQAKVMLRRLLTDVSLDISMTLWFLIVDLHDYPKGSGKVNYKGILKTKPEIAPKVAYKALQKLGSLIYGDVRPNNSTIHILDGNGPATSKEYSAMENCEAVGLPNLNSTLLTTGNGKVLAYWSMDKPGNEVTDKSVHIFLWDWENYGFQEPVLVDPLEGNIYEIDDQEKFYDKNKLSTELEAQVFRKVPLRDYPMLIMERNSVTA